MTLILNILGTMALGAVVTILVGFALVVGSWAFAALRGVIKGGNPW